MMFKIYECIYIYFCRLVGILFLDAFPIQDNSSSFHVNYAPLFHKLHSLDFEGRERARERERERNWIDRYTYMDR